jgi:CRISPR-associated exonuclease Cas4
MIIAVLATGLALVIVLYLMIGIAVHHASKRLGVADGTLVAADQSLSGFKTLYSERLALAGRPDQLLRVGQVVVPVEHKPHAKSVYESHVMQLAAECALVEAVYGTIPPYGVLMLAGGMKHEIPYTHALEQRLVQMMSTMREYLRTRTEPGPRWVTRKCPACGYRTQCWPNSDR